MNIDSLQDEQGKKKEDFFHSVRPKIKATVHEQCLHFDLLHVHGHMPAVYKQ